MRWRLLNRLEKSVKSFGRKVVNLVDDEHLVAAHHRLVLSHFDDLFANIIYSRFACRVHLDDIRCVPGSDLHTLGTYIARRWSRASLTIQTLGEQPGGRGFPGSTRTGEEKGLRDSTRADSRLERSNYVLLPYQIFKRLTAIFSVESNLRHVGFRKKWWESREDCVAQRIDLPLLPSSPSGVHRPAAAQFPVEDCSIYGVLSRPGLINLRNIPDREYLAQILIISY